MCHKETSARKWEPWLLGAFPLASSLAKEDVTLNNDTCADLHTYAHSWYMFTSLLCIEKHINSLRWRPWANTLMSPKAKHYTDLILTTERWRRCHFHFMEKEQRLWEVSDLPWGHMAEPGPQHLPDSKARASCPQPLGSDPECSAVFLV